MRTVIFVGPKKTGTSWLHHVVRGSTRAKEIRYPARWGRKFVYRRFVQGQSLLIWPYLLHERDCLAALLDDLESRGAAVRIVVSLRDDAEWMVSMRKFLEKYGCSPEEARVEASRERQVVMENLQWLRARTEMETVRIIEPDEQDLYRMSVACAVPVERLRAAKAERVYESSESSRVPSRRLVEFFFRVKPFLPGNLQELTKTRWLRTVFFRPRQSHDTERDERS